MPYTLQRKMFKLGGSVAHGGGITANLKNPNRVKMKKGGSVAPIGLVGKGPLHMKGPDGKMREMQNPLALLGLLARAGGTVGLRTIPNILRGLGSRSTKPISDFVMKSATGASRPTAKQLAKMTPAMIKRTVGNFGFGPTGRMSQIGRGLETGIGALAPVGLASSFLPELEKGKDKPISTLIQNLREIPELALNTAIGIPSGLVGALAGQGMAGFTPSDAIQKTLYGDDKKIGSDLVDQSTTGDTVAKQLSQMEKMKEDALARKELYNEVMYQPDKLKMLSDAALGAGTSALRGDELADVIESGFAPINVEAQRKQTIDQASGQQAVTDILNEGAVNRQIVAEVAKTGDPRAIARVNKYLEASEKGVDDLLPLDAKGAMDTTQMRAGALYADIDNATGKLFVAVNKSGSEIKQFDTVEEAIEHSQKA